MAEKTPIQWPDSAINPVMGCDGCELWQPDRGIKHCYAGVLHTLRGGKVKGYAQRFDVPETFAGRMFKAAAWSDLTGKVRPDKPWLDGLPRIIFISDMGDALSEGISFEYLLDEVIANVRSEKGRRHRWMWLTKRPARMAKFAAWLWERGIVWPRNLWAGTSLTGPEQMGRVRQLREVPAMFRFVSAEPLLGPVNWAHVTEGMAQIIFGGESGPGARPCDVRWIRAGVEVCRREGVSPFVKQLGAKAAAHGFEPAIDAPETGIARRFDGSLSLRDSHGGDWLEWPKDMRVREVPR